MTVGLLVLPEGKFSIRPRRFFRPKLKQAAKLPEEGEPDGLICAEIPAKTA